MLFTVDEYFTYGLIKFPLMHGITITMADVHPPLYYIILKVFIKLLSPLGLDILYISKIITLIPYIFILLISATKIKEEYNWLTAGLFTFLLYSMTEFFMFYLTIRMYSWACLFLVLSFIYLKDVLIKSDLKSWSLFTLFTLLGAYTHYFCAISSIAIYLILLIYFIIMKNSFLHEFKKWSASVIALMIGYVPWGFTLITQLNNVHNTYWIPQIDLSYFIYCLTYYSTISFESYIVTLAIVLLFVLLSIAIFKSMQNDATIEDNYVLMGILVLFATLFLGIVISFTFKPIL